MLIKERYSIKDMVSWTRKETLFFLGYSFFITLLYKVFDFTFLNIPWTPVALIGTAVAFIIGFQNNAAYGRIWEARKIWGGIVNTSRTWGMKVKDMVTPEYCTYQVTDQEIQENVKTLNYRHFAWLTALRHAMREPRKWEVFEKHKTNREWSRMVHIQEKVFTLEDEIRAYLEPDEWEYTLSKKNKAAALLFLQSKHLRKLKEKGLIWEFAFLELENLLEEMFTLQGKSERIKNFPYPRQYATLSNYFVWIFLLLLPIGLVPEFADISVSLYNAFPTLSNFFIWLVVPFCGIVSWVFHTMMRIGTVGENPFEGSANDVPISTIARGIEIDMRQLMNENDETIPEPFPEEYDVQM
jgi:putative membrane protein